MDSARLPGKPLAKAGPGVLLDFVVERAQKISGLDSLVLATTSRELDDPLIDFASSASIDFFRGEVDNVAKRALDCAREFEADYIVRLNADSPYLQPELISLGLDVARFEHPDLVTNIFPRTFPYGVSVEIIKTASLLSSISKFNGSESEHLTSYFYSNPDDFHIANISADIEYDPSARLVVDNPEDLDVFRGIAKSLGANYSSATLPQILERLGDRGATIL
jgi:spore coat polysaccharide biosynthesis protein SpsF